MFKLHEQLKSDCERLGRFELCQVLLMRDANYPWCILVPERADIREIHQLNAADRLQLMHESHQLSTTMAAVFKADKMNIAALGNVVPQLHIHHIVRYRNDLAWPAPVWGKLPARSYTAETLTQTVTQLREALATGLKQD